VAATDDEVDLIIDAWARQRPDIDFAPLDVFSRLRRIARRLDAVRGAAFGRSELDTWEFDVLSTLRRSGEPYQLSPKHLVTATMVTSGTMTNRVDRLVARGLVERRVDPNDGRGVVVQLTDDGLQRVDQAMLDLVQAEEERLADLTPQQQAQLGGLLRRLNEGFPS